jgi:hypothetical protein
MSPKKNRAWRIRQICDWILQTEEEDWRENDYNEDHIFGMAYILKHGKPEYNEYRKFTKKEMEAFPTWNHR